MPDSRLDKIRQHLEELKARLVRGDVDEAAYSRMKNEVLSDLSPQERRALGPVAMGPSGLHTQVPSLAELELAPGTVLFDQWRIVRELGRGGFGVVFEAEEVHLGEIQAVKVLDPAKSSRLELLARFRREVTVMRRLDPRHIVRVYDYREDPDEHLALISMEYVAGGTVRALRDLAREKEQPVPVAAIVAILAQTLEALAEAHAQGVIHRDVTPGNILLAGAGVEELLAEPSRDPGVKLVDFGIAGLVEHAERSQKSRALGTAAYVAPEALEPDGVVTPAADVYGAGAVAYELLTGKLPLGRFPQPSETRSDVPPELDRLVPELLDLDPAKRPSARRARNRTLARTIEPASPVGKGRWAWVGAAAVLAVAVLFVVFGDWPSPGPGGDEGPEPVSQPVEAVEEAAEPADQEPPPDDGTPVEQDVAEAANDETPANQESESVGVPAEEDAIAVAVPPAAIEAKPAEQTAEQNSSVMPRRDEVVEPPTSIPSSWQDPKIGMRFRYIPKGTFTMGSPEDGSERGEVERSGTAPRDQSGGGRGVLEEGGSWGLAPWSPSNFFRRVPEPIGRLNIAQGVSPGILSRSSAGRATPGKA